MSDMKLDLTLSANAGVSLQFRSAKIWIDALHDEGLPGYSTLNAERIRQMEQTEAFSDPDVIIFTHTHEDHFSRRLAAKAMKDWPEAKVFIPEDVLPGAVLLDRDIEEITAGDVRITFVRMTHMGDHYAHVPHYAVMMQEDGFTVLFAADTALGSRELQAFCADKHTDAALLPFPWVTLRLGRSFVEEQIRPEHVFLLHLPFEGEDTEGYREATAKCYTKLKGCSDVRVLGEFLQHETIDR